MSEDLDDIIFDLCPYCKQIFDAEEHDLKSCFQASFRMVTEANAKLQELMDGRGNLHEENVPRHRRWFSNLQYFINDWLRVPSAIISMILMYYLILALQRFIEKGIL